MWCLSIQPTGGKCFDGPVINQSQGMSQCSLKFKLTEAKQFECQTISMHGKY